MIEIKHRVTYKVLLKVDSDTLSFADLSYANLRGVKGSFIYNWGVKLKVVNDEELKDE